MGLIILYLRFSSRMQTPFGVTWKRSASAARKPPRRAARKFVLFEGGRVTQRVRAGDVATASAAINHQNHPDHVLSDSQSEEILKWNPNCTWATCPTISRRTTCASYLVRRAKSKTSN